MFYWIRVNQEAAVAYVYPVNLIILFNFQTNLQLPRKAEPLNHIRNERSQIW
jgi:hypothetical protein